MFSSGTAIGQTLISWHAGDLNDDQAVNAILRHILIVGAGMVAGSVAAAPCASATGPMAARCAWAASQLASASMASLLDLMEANTASYCSSGKECENSAAHGDNNADPGANQAWKSMNDDAADGSHAANKKYGKHKYSDKDM